MQTTDTTTIQIDPKKRHDLLTPINQIIGYSEMLVEETNEAQQSQYLADLQKIILAAKNLAGQINLLFNQNENKTTADPSINATHEAVITSAINHDLTERILIVDDVEENRDILSRRLKKRAYICDEAENGTLALNKISQKHFDLVLLDIMMPETDGYTVLKTMKNDSNLRNIPVIMISAVTEMDSIIRCIEMGAEDYLTKPFNATLLYARVKACLEKKRLLEQEKDHLAEKLQTEATLERLRSLAQMVAGVAHEINTPLGVINTAATILDSRLHQPSVKEQFSDHAPVFEEIAEASDLIKKNINRAHSLIQNFKKISVNQATDSKESVNIIDTVKDSIELFKINARHANLEIILEDNIQQDRAWLGYPGYLTQIVINLLTNIERYAYPNSSGGKVIIAITDNVQNDQPCFVITVTDFGQGISPENLAKIFEPFFTTGRAQGGTGLGLAIIHNIITTIFKGDIQVHSELMKGTSFNISIPSSL